MIKELQEIYSQLKGRIGNFLEIGLNHMTAPRTPIITTFMRTARHFRYLLCRRLCQLSQCTQVVMDRCSWPSSATVQLVVLVA